MKGSYSPFCCGGRTVANRQSPLRDQVIELDTRTVRIGLMESRMVRIGPSRNMEAEEGAVILPPRLRLKLPTPTKTGVSNVDKPVSILRSSSTLLYSSLSGLPNRQEEEEQQQRNAHPAGRTGVETEKRISLLQKAGLVISAKSLPNARQTNRVDSMVPDSSLALAIDLTATLSSKSSMTAPWLQSPPNDHTNVDPIIGARPSYHGKRVSIEDFPDPGSFCWDFVGSCEDRLIESFEKDFGWNAGRVQLDLYYTTGNIDIIIEKPLRIRGTWNDIVLPNNNCGKKNGPKSITRAISAKDVAREKSYSSKSRVLQQFPSSGVSVSPEVYRRILIDPFEWSSQCILK